jgi:broad specificity phosphatase PhoE
MSRLLLVRHSKVKEGAQRYYGHSQVDLSPEGIIQAEMVRDRLAREKIDAIYSSDLKCARLTAEIIASVHLVEVVLCHELRENDFGEIEVMTFEEVEKCCPGEARPWRGGDPDMAAPKGGNLRRSLAAFSSSWEGFKGIYRRKRY